MLLVHDILRRRYHFKLVELTPELFLQWTADEMYNLSFGLVRKVPRKNVWRPQWKIKQIPFPYARLIHQLQLEDEHGNSNQGHEAQRRQSYAQRVLDKLGEELENTNPEPHWRSKVLTPIMQRQLQGICDAYAPSVESAVYAGEPLDSDDEDEEKITIANATEFYLDRDPLNPAEIPNYRRNMIYIHQMKWHLSILLDKFPVTSVDWYHRSLSLHDKQMRSKVFPDDEATAIPPFSPMDVQFIVFSHLEDYFAGDIKDQDQVSATLFTLRFSIYVCTDIFSKSLTPAKR